jgi:hypothetical protein
LCTKAKKQARGLKLQPREEYEALQQARARQASDRGKQLYKRRAGIEARFPKASGDSTCATLAIEV